MKKKIQKTVGKIKSENMLIKDRGGNCTNRNNNVGGRFVRNVGKPHKDRINIKTKSM
jgi:hypothetical protein